MEQHSPSPPLPFAQRLKQERLFLGWSQARLAEELRTDVKTVSRWERSLAFPSSTLRERLSQVLGKNQQELGLLEEGESVPRPRSRVVDSLLPHPGLFVGRDAEQEAVKRLLLANPHMRLALCAMSGLPGVGKTTLVVQLARDEEVQAQFADGILWAALGPSPHLESHFARWGRMLGISSDEMTRLTTTGLWQEALRLAIGRRQMLVVLDDVWKLEDALACEIGSECGYLLTTRFPDIALSFAASSFSLHELGEEEGLSLMKALCPLVVEQEEEQVRALIRAVGGLPLALTLMGNYLRTQSHSAQRRRIQAALSDLSSPAHSWLHLTVPRSPLEAHPSLDSGARLSLQSVIAVSDQMLSQVQRSAFYALSVLPSKPDSFSEEAALAVTGAAPQVLDRLTDAGLLSTTEAGRYHLHQTIAEYASRGLEERERAQAHAHLFSFVRHLLNKPVSEYPVIEAETSVVLAAIEAAEQEGKGSEMLHLVVAYLPLLYARGQYIQADRLLQRAYAACFTSEGVLPSPVPADEEALCSLLYWMGRLAGMLGRFEEADERLSQGMLLARQGGYQRRLVDVLHIRARFLWRLGENAQAEGYLQEGLQIAREIGYREGLVVTLGTLGSTRYTRGDPETSRLVLQEALTLAREGGDQEQLCLLLIALSVTLPYTESWQEVEPLMEEALVIAKRIGHREWTVALLINLAEWLTEGGRHTRAEILLHEASTLIQHFTHREAFFMVYIGLAAVMTAQERSGEADAYLQHCRPMVASIGTLRVRSYFYLQEGLLALLEQRLDDAEDAFQQMDETTGEHDRELRAKWLFAQARLSLARGDTERAKLLVAQSFSVLEGIGHQMQLLLRQFQSELDGGETS